MKKLSALLLAICLFASCNNTTLVDEPPTEDIEKQERIARYGSWIDVSVCRQMVDQLDYLFQASAYRDSLLHGSDTEIVMKRQFSNPNIQPPQFNEKGEIYKWHYVSENTISHNGISLYEDGAKWTVNSSTERFWHAPNQPEKIETQWTVRRENGIYTLSGGMIHNGLWEEYFTLTEFSDLQFTIGRVVVKTIFYQDNTYITEPKSTLRYCFDGDIDITKVENVENTTNTIIEISLEELNGYNAKEYLDYEPIFTADLKYFKSGKINVKVLDEQEPLHFVADFGHGAIQYSDL